MSEQPDDVATAPATDAGTTRPAGEGLGEDQLQEEVAEQTSNDLDVEGAFERESDGAASETEAAKASGDELR